MIYGKELQKTFRIPFSEPKVDDYFDAYSKMYAVPFNNELWWIVHVDYSKRTDTVLFKIEKDFKLMI